ncbi:hypothetical protein B1757_05780 [Acidithiobacillus marinus]|uniref:GGDEF-domain containing protein n=1 Tax=Acidithiobacillus marinus TaxID=187490 RepID=A0A2I1DMU4_9PROT|nr:EAL domain-containing protein [Acidithiobacillus marinus]PKY11188.1 hypothetical protein B1757_05780 [Acidithiobacillus marinus]
MSSSQATLSAKNTVMSASLDKLMHGTQRLQRLQRVFTLGIILAFVSLAVLTVFSIGSWQAHLLERSRDRTKDMAVHLAESFSSNLSAMIEMHMRDLQFMASLPTRELSQGLVQRFNKVHPWLNNVSCNLNEQKSAQFTVNYPLIFGSDSRFIWQGGVNQPFADAKGLLHIPLRLFAVPLQPSLKRIKKAGRSCHAELFFGNQHASASLERAHILLLLDNHHRVLAQWQNGRWQQGKPVPAAWTAALDLPVKHTPWIISARWNPQPNPDLQHQLKRLDIWTLLLLAAETTLAGAALIWMYRRFVENRYQRAHQTLHEMVAKAANPQEIYAGLVQLSVLGTGALAAYVAIPGAERDSLSVIAACARNPGLVDILRQLPLSVDPENSPWGQLLPALAWRLRQRVDPRTPHVSGEMAKVIVLYPALKDFREVIAWPVIPETARQPEAVFVLEITRLSRWLFGYHLIAHWEALLHDLERYLERLQDLREKEHLLQTDTLTGLPNRSHFTDLVSEQLQSASSATEMRGLGLMDLDLFNEINTSFSSLAADQCLQEIARQLKTTLQFSDAVLARVGGDEFGLLIPISGETQLEQYSQDLLQAVQAAAQKTLEAHLTTSLGWSLFPADSREVCMLMAQADEALSEAKRQGGNTFRLYGGEVARRARQRLWVRRDFPGAVQRGEIRFFLQPKADMQNNCLSGVEMLARWCPPQGHWIGPGKFMPYVEENAHLIRILGRWALQEAVRLRQRMQSEGLGLQVSLNIGAKHFLDPAFKEDVEILCPDGHGLTLEITETASVMGRKSVLPMMAWCQSRGFKLSMDDFGTGYSSLLSVARLNFDELKLDQSFIRAFRQDKASFGVAGASHMLSRLTACELVAEGVSTPEELHLWLLLGGRHIQGYLLSPPLPENAFFLWKNYLLPSVIRPLDPAGARDLLELWQQIHPEQSTSV